MFDKFKNVLGDLSDFDPEKVKDVVETVWEDREKITDSAHLVWENRDEILGVIEFVREHKDQILNFIKQVPELLSKTGDGIVSAGDAAVRASGFLTGADSDDMSAQRLSEVAADALDACRDQLANVASLMGNVGEQVSKFHIPTVEPKYTEVMGFNLVSGLDFGEMSLLDDAADQLDKGKGNVDGIASSLESVARQLRHLGARLTEAGTDLDRVGGQLQESGGMLQSVVSIVE